MNLHQEQLIIFKTVIEKGSFSAAARALGKVPSAVSMSIANFEIDLNLTLFDRSGREPIPTAAAWVLYEKTQQLLLEMNQWKQHAQALSQGLETQLNLVIVSELMHIDWTSYVALLEQHFPQLQINIFSAPQEDVMQMLMNKQADLALMFEREVLKHSEQFIEVKNETLIPVISVHHPLAQFEQVEFEQILQTRQIVVASRDRHIKPELLFSKNYWRTDQHHAALCLIIQGLGWGILPVQMLNENPILKQKLKPLKILDFTPEFTYFVDLVWSRQHQLGFAARFLINHIKNHRNLMQNKSPKSKFVL